MSELINGRTAEEIKTAMRCCRLPVNQGCNVCPYNGMCLEHEPEADAILLIERLESERDAALAKVPEPPDRSASYQDRLIRESDVKRVLRKIKRDWMLCSHKETKTVLTIAEGALTGCKTQTSMINADALFGLIAGHSLYRGDKILSAICCMKEGKRVEHIAPSVDAVPVVRCEECVCCTMWNDQLICLRIRDVMDGYYHGTAEVVNPDDYCSRGKRRMAKLHNTKIGR